MVGYTKMEKYIAYICAEYFLTLHTTIIGKNKNVNEIRISRGSILQQTKTNYNLSILTVVHSEVSCCVLCCPPNA